MKAEKKNKVRNVVLGAYDSYIDVYKDYITKYSVIDKNDVIHFNKKFLIEHLNNLPNSFVSGLKLYSNNVLNDNNFKDLFLFNFSHLERKFLIEIYLKSINFKYSIYGMLSGLYSTDLNKSVIFF